MKTKANLDETFIIIQNPQWRGFTLHMHTYKCSLLIRAYSPHEQFCNRSRTLMIFNSAELIPYLFFTRLFSVRFDPAVVSFGFLIIFNLKFVAIFLYLCFYYFYYYYCSYISYRIAMIFALELMSPFVFHYFSRFFVCVLQCLSSM